LADKIRVDVDHLQIGMAVIELDRPWIDSPFLLQGFTITSKSDIRALQEHCEYVYIDPLTSQVDKKVNRKTRSDKSGYFNRLFMNRQEAVVSTPVEQEIKTATKVHSKASVMVKHCLDDIVLGNAINEKVVKENVTETVESIVRNPDAMMWLTRLQNKDDHSSQHSINCCILCVSFGRYIGLPNSELEKLAIGALMHDVGKLQVPTEILNKPGPLTAEETRVMHGHPTASRNLLMSAGSYFAPAVDIAFSHHERIDGSGYPRGLNGQGLTPFSRMVAIIDVYDMMTSDQVYREARPPFEALKYLNQNKGKLFDSQLVALFIKMIGVFPVGSIVELTNGQIGVVITSNRDDNLRPKVLIMLDSNKMPAKREVLNLARNVVDSLGRPIKIIKTLRKGDYGIDQQQLIQEGVQFTVLN
jgi:HD-GYP domain-containing protein (c-di-GMP phosphodiesterase class II)